jgi:hypothetical protein
MASDDGGLGCLVTLTCAIASASAGVLAVGYFVDNILPFAHSSTPDTQRTPQQDIHVSSVTFDRDTIAKEIRDISVPFNNCSGTGEISQEYETSETLKHEYTLGTARSVNFAISILLVELQKEVSFGLEESETKKATTNIKVAARSNVEYIVTTREIWQKGIIHAEVNQENMQIPFEVRSNIDAVITGSKSLPCPTIQTQQIRE